MKKKEVRWVDLSQYELLNRIGSGAFSDVYEVREKKKGIIYAAKISKESFDDIKKSSESIHNIVREVNHLFKANHPSIIKLIGFSPYDFRGKNKSVLITEYLPNGSLRKYIDLECCGRSDPKWDDTRKLIIIYGIANAMAFLHRHNIIHRDLKPENILLDENMNPIIADLGLSKDLSGLSYSSMKGLKGTMMYMSPEILFKNDYTEKGDVYAFAMIVYEIITNDRPFKECNFNTLFKKLSKGFRPEINQLVPEEYKSLIERCWDQDPSCRPSFSDIVNELNNEPGFITNLVDYDEFIDYVNYINDYHENFNISKQILSFENFYEFNQMNNQKKATNKTSTDGNSSSSLFYIDTDSSFDNKKKNVKNKISTDGNSSKYDFNFDKYDLNYKKKTY